MSLPVTSTKLALPLSCEELVSKDLRENVVGEGSLVRERQSQEERKGTKTILPNLPCGETISYPHS